MKPTLRSALGFAVACFVGVATSGCRVVRRTLRQTALLAVLCAAPIWAKAVYQNGTAALNVNFAITTKTGASSRLAASTNYGVVPFPGSKWHEMSGAQSNGRVSVTASSLTDSAGNGSATVTINACVFEEQNASAGAILLRDAAIDDYNDGKPESTLTIADIPYACYDVYLYMAGTAYAYNSPVRIKATDGTYSDYYYMPANKEAALTSTSAQTWGSAQTWASTKLGVNVMRIADLTSSSITFATQQLSDARANFAAIQIVERVAATTYEATLEANASVAATELGVTLSSDGATTKKLSEVTAEESVSITLAGDATISGAVTAKHLQVTGTGTLTCSGAVTVAGEIRVETGANLVLASATTSAATTISGGGTVNLTPTSLGGAVTATTDLILTAPESATEDNPHTISQALTIGVNDGRQLGSLTTKGNLKLLNTSNVFYGDLTVESGTLQLAALKEEGIRKTLTIKAGAKCTALNTDALNQKSGAVVAVKVYGTLNLGSYRWTFGSGSSSVSSLTCYTGSTITGSGDSYGAIDVNYQATNGASNINFEKADPDGEPGEVDFGATIRLRIGAVRLNVAEGVTVNFTGARSTLDHTTEAFSKAGAGLLKVKTTALTFNGPCSGPIEVQANNTLTLGSGSSAVAHTASITGAGSVVLTGANTTLTLPEKTTTPIEVQSDATLKIPVTEAELESGYTASTVTVTAGTVKFVTPSGQEIAATGEGNNVLASEVVWTGTAGDSAWSTATNWQGNAVPGESAYVSIPLTTALSLKLPEGGATVARLRVSGTDAANTLTLSGGALTVNGSILLAGANLTATTATLPLATVTAIDLGEGTALDYTVTSAVALPALTGSGTFTKRGSADMTFKNATTAYLAQVVVAEGILDTGEIQTASEFHITVEADATFLTRSTTSLTSTASTLCLKGGAIFDLRNGNGNATRPIRAAITINATNDNPAIIQGSRNGNASNLQGAITGKGTLEIRKAPDQADASPFTISGIISDAAPGALALKVTQTGTNAAVTLTRDNTYTGGTTIAEGATVIVETISKLGPRGTVQVEDGGTLKLVNLSDLQDHETTDYSRVKGSGTIWYYCTNSTAKWRTLPSEASRQPSKTLSVRNDLTAGLIITLNGSAAPETTLGSISGSGNFRSDWSGGDDSRSLRIVQSKNTEHNDIFISSSGNTRLKQVIVAGADGATEKTLTLSGNTTTTARPLEIESSGSVKLTGSWNAAITINGALEVPVESGEKTISTVLAGTTGTLTKSGAGQLNLTGANTFSGTVAITGGILNVGSNRGFTVSAIESDAKLVLSPTESEIAAGQIALTMANGVTLSADQLSVTDYPGVTGADGYIYLTNPCWKPTAEDAAWEHNWYRGTTAMATAPTSGEIEVNFSALTAETEVTIPSGTFDAVTFFGGEAEACSLVVTLGEEVTLGALTVSGRVTLPDTAIAAATEVTAGATLSLTGSGATISTAITGAGSLCQRSGSTSLTGANTYTGTTTVAAEATLSLAGENVLSDAFGDGSAVIVNGTLKLAAGSYCRRTTGAGTIRVLNDQTFAIGQAALPNGETWSADKTTGLTGFTGTLALVGNFELRNAGPAEYTYAPGGFNVRFEADDQGSSDGQLISASATSPVQAVLAAGCTLSGKGFVKCPIAFEADSVIEVTMATNLDLSEATITLPSGEGEHILLKADVASNGFLYVAPSANVPASVFAFAEESTVKADTAAITVYRSSTEDTVQVITNPPVPDGTADGVAAAIRDQANLNGMPVTVQAVTTDETKPKVKLDGALFFENVVKTEFSYETFQVTATVTYDFGVSAITVKKLTLAGTEQLCVVVCAKVESAATSTAATFKESAQVQLYLNDALCNAATALTSAIDSSVNDGDKSVRWFAVPLSSLPTTGTNAFTVKVTEQAATP